MKKNFSEILDGLNAEETEILLEGLALSDEIPEITSARLKKAALKRIKANGKAKKTVVRRILPKHWRAAAAACLAALILAGAGGGYAYAENKEYKEAIAFFSENGLSAEGLTRAEIKRVYRDIKTESFTYSKTAEVISRNMAVNRVPGYEILQNSPSPIDLKNAWDFKWFKTPPQSMGVHYEWRFDENLRNIASGVYGLVIEKYDGKELVWSVHIDDFELNGFEEVTDGIIAYGCKESWREDPDNPGCFFGVGDCSYMIAKLDTDGRMLWERVVDSGFEKAMKNEWIVKILEESDGSYSVFSNVYLYSEQRADLHNHYLCLTKYTADGDRISFNKQETEAGLINVIHFGEGYLMQFYDTDEARGNAKLALTDLNGAVTKEFMYDSDESYYFIKDMAEFGGKIYLSADVVPKGGAGEKCGRICIGAVQHYIDENHVFEKAQGQDYDGNYYNEEVQEAMSEQLVPVMRANHTAVLLVCDPAGGKPREFYSVEGSMGGSLSVNAEGELSWNVESIVKTYFSPVTNAFTIYGQSRVFKYVFGAGGNLISQTETDETVPFMF